MGLWSGLTLFFAVLANLRSALRAFGSGMASLLTDTTGAGKDLWVGAVGFVVTM